MIRQFSDQDFEPRSSEKGGQVSRAFLLSACLLVACSGVDAQGNAAPDDQEGAATAGPELNRVAYSAETSGPRELMPARFFVDPANRSNLSVVREYTEPTATMNGHYSLAMVSCGTACMSYWIVDRHTGAVIDVPGRSDESGTGDIEMIYDVRGRLDSDMIRISYHPMDNPTDSCWSQDFRLSGNTLSPTGGSFRVPCPGRRRPPVPG